MISILVLAALALDPSLTRLRAEDARLATIGWRLQTANAGRCPGQHVIGITVDALSQYPRDVQAKLALTDRPGVAAVAQGSAAERATLKAGDILMSINRQPTPVVTPKAGYAPIGATETMLDKAADGKAILLEIQREGVAKTVELTPDAGCASHIQIIPGRSINAQADGRYVQINAAMLDFVANDDELATIVAHELAHNISRHIALKTPSKQSEYEADRLGVALMVRAGFNIDAVVPFWTRFEKRTNAGIFADGTHPSSKKRLAAVAAAVAEWKYGQLLVPPSQNEKPR